MTAAVWIRRPSRAARIGYGALGVVGELLITLGLLIVAFLVWQLWWTDVVADRQQADVLSGLSWAVPADDGHGPSAGGRTGEAGGTGSGPAVVVPRHDEPPVATAPAHATTFATLRVPRWTGEPARPISEGTDKRTVLDVLGIGHYEGTAMPGGLGNFAIAGHRTTYGKPFNRIEELAVGDPLVVQTAQAWYVYRVTSTQVVGPSDVSVIAPVPGEPGAQPTARSITLTTCHPMYSARQRYIVHGELDYWAPVDGTSVPAELLGAAS